MKINTSDKQAKKLYRRHCASRYLKEHWGLDFAPRTLAKAACVSSDGPEMHYVGRIPYYTQTALDEFALNKIGPSCRSTSDKPRQPPASTSATQIRRADHF